MDDIYSIASSGMAAQRVQMNLIAENLANAGLPRTDGTAFRPRSAVFAPAGSFEQALSGALDVAGGESVGFFDAPSALADESLAPETGRPSGFDWDVSSGVPSSQIDVPVAATTDGFSGVSVADVVDDSQPIQYTFDPGNPFAAKSGPRKGYVALPGVDPIQEMVAMMSAGRAYDANVSMLSAAKQMDIEAADIGRL